MGRNTFEVTTNNFQEQVEASDLPVLVDIGSMWCPACQTIAPIVENLAGKYRNQMRVGRLDSERNPELVEQFQVMGLPTLILFHNGVEVQRMVGVGQPDSIEAQMTRYLSD